MNVRRQGALAAVVAAGLFVGFSLGTTASASPSSSHSSLSSLYQADDTDYAEAIADIQEERKENEQALDELQAALEDTEREIVEADRRLKDLEARLPVAQAELDAAEAELQVLLQHQREVEERLAAAEAEDARVARQIKDDEERLAELKAIVAELARATYRGTTADTTLEVVFGAKSAEDFVNEVATQLTLNRTQGNALAEMEQIAAMNRNRGARQEAVREYIAALKILADQYVAEAEEVKAEAEEKKEEIEELLAEQTQIKKYLEEKEKEFLEKEDELEEQAKQLEDDLIALILESHGRGFTYFDGTWVYPVNNPVVVSPYGMRFHPIFHVWRMHYGTDFRAPCGVPIYSAADGWVEWTKYLYGYGNQVLVNHGEYEGTSYMSSYNHLSSFAVTPGDYVVRGQVVAYSGTTGNSTGCHLHFELYVNGRAVNPMTYMP
jgi:murein DD-endopeptidase MepM/ murein hydrolase activator NlpD